MSIKEEILKIVIDHPEIFDAVRERARDLLAIQNSPDLVDIKHS